MKTLFFSLLVFATIFALSLGFSDGNKKDRRKVLVNLENENARFLQKKSPPGKVPGPKLTYELNYNIFNDEESNIKHFSDKNRRHKEGKDVNLRTGSDEFAFLNKNSRDERGRNQGKSAVSGAQYKFEGKKKTQDETTHE